VRWRGIEGIRVIAPPNSESLCATMQEQNRPPQRTGAGEVDVPEGASGGEGGLVFQDRVNVVE
jgi:hypothetical protein